MSFNSLENLSDVVKNVALEAAKAALPKKEETSFTIQEWVVNASGNTSAVPTQTQTEQGTKEKPVRIEVGNFSEDMHEAEVSVSGGYSVISLKDPLKNVGIRAQAGTHTIELPEGSCIKCSTGKTPPITDISFYGPGQSADASNRIMTRNDEHCNIDVKIGDKLVPMLRDGKPTQQFEALEKNKEFAGGADLQKLLATTPPPAPQKQGVAL